MSFGPSRLPAANAERDRKQTLAPCAGDGALSCVSRTSRAPKYATTVLPGTVRQSALERIEWHKSQGDDVVVVSASLDVYLGPWCEKHDIAWICTTLEERDGSLTGKYVDGDCTGAEKVRRIRQRYELAQYALVYAYGDSREDREMLELAHKRYYRWREIISWDEVTSYGLVG
jgi:HAD superfamily hydrolase (TIGR01490 family)